MIPSPPNLRRRIFLWLFREQIAFRFARPRARHLLISGFKRHWVVSTLTSGVIVSFVAYRLLGFDLFLPLLADLVPLLIAVVGIVMSYRQPRKETHLMATVVLICAGLAGTAIISWNRIRTEHAHKMETKDLNDKLDRQGRKIESVGDQNAAILKQALSTPGSSPQAGSADNPQLLKRKNVLALLRNEYILSHENISPGLLAGTEFPPADWMNRRLRQLGEKWTFVRPSTTAAGSQGATGAIPTAIELMVAVGNDEASHVGYDRPPKVENWGWIDFERHCEKPLRCYPERDITDSSPIHIDPGAKGWFRLFISAYNVGGSAVSHPTVECGLARGDGVSIYKANQRLSTPNRSIELNPNETLDLAPFSRSKNGYDYVYDVTVGPSVEKFAVLFRIYSPNLDVHELLIPLQAER